MLSGPAPEAPAAAGRRGAVRGVDLVGEIAVSAREGDVLLDAAGPDVALVARLGAAVPGGSGAVHRADVEIVAVADDPDRQRAARRAVAPQRRELQLVRLPDLGKLVARPRVIGAAPVSWA